MKPHLAGYRKKRSRFGSGIVTLVMLASLLWGGMAWNVQEASAASKFDNIMNPELPSGFDADDTTNPYNNGKQKFLLAENNELTVYKSWDVGSDEIARKNMWVSTFDNYTPGGSMKLMAGDNDADAQNKGGWKSVTADTSANATKFNYLDAVAFDPNGTGRKDHVAYVGYYQKGSSKGNYLLVYDTVKKSGRPPKICRGPVMHPASIISSPGTSIPSLPETTTETERTPSWSTIRLSTGNTA